ncbi:hypothetical protein JTB14_014130 [Gonioctena quinquepunctata]|nr:hypothetical protein JTB14_014130 [Gonioctena quinquepunctata]
MDRWLINISTTKSNNEKVFVSSSDRIGASRCANTEPQPKTSFQSSNFAEEQKEQLYPQTSPDMEVEDEQLVDYCAEDAEGYNTENEKNKQLTSSKSTVKGVKKVFKKFRLDWLKLPEFKAWLIKGNSDDNAICKVCNVVMKAGE